MTPGSPIRAALLDDVAEVHSAPADDVLDRLPCPRSLVAVGDPLTVEQLGQRTERVPDELIPDPADHCSFLGHDAEFAGMNEVAFVVMATPVAEGS